MAGDQTKNDVAQPPSLGTCCTELKDAMQADEFDPLITVGEDGVLMLGVGLVDLEDNEQGIVDHPLFFCPFCGTKLQSEEELRSREDEATG